VTAGIATARGPFLRNSSPISRGSAASFILCAPCQKRCQERCATTIPDASRGILFGRRVIEMRGRSPWTRPGPGAHEIEPGRGGTPALANSGSPGSWASPRANRWRVMRSHLGPRATDGFLHHGTSDLFRKPCPGMPSPRMSRSSSGASRRQPRRTARSATCRAPCSDVLRIAGTIRRPASQWPEGRS
jgi:hypothetical protein